MTVEVRPCKFPAFRQAWAAGVMLLCLLCVPDTSFSNAGEASPEATRNGDFDFEFGAWDIHLSRRLNPLSGSDEWVEYSGSSVVRKVWDGRANLGELNVDGPAGSIQGLSLRLYNPDTDQWHIHWASSRDGLVGEAMVGGFEDGIGRFYNQEMFDGRMVAVRFVFSEITPTTFSLEQAFSEDDGASWEANWIAKFERRSDASADGAVRAVWSTLDEAWNAREAEPFADLFTVDTSFQFVDRGESLEGRAVVRDYFAERFPRFAPDLRHRTSVQRVRPVAEDVRALDGTVEILRVASDAEPAVLRTFAIFAMMARDGDDWRIDVLRVYQLPAESE